MRSLKHVLPLTGLSMLLLAGCQTQTNPSVQPVAQPVPARATPARAAPVVDPINDPSLRDNDNGGGGNNGGGGGGGGGSGPGGGGGGSWG